MTTKELYLAITQFLARGTAFKTWFEEYDPHTPGFSFTTQSLIHAVSSDNHFVLRLEDGKLLVEEYSIRSIRGGYEPELTIDLEHPDSFIKLGEFFGMTREECESQTAPINPLDPIAAIADLL